MSLIEPAKINLKMIAAAAIVIVILAAVGYHYWTKNALEAEIQRQKEARSQEHQERIDEQKTEVNASANVANEAKANTQKIENANFTNTNLSEAERLRCRAFPNSKGC